MPKTAPTAEVVKKLTTWPVNLQSFAQWVGIMGALLGGVAYTERRITTLEVNARHQSELLQEQRELMKEARDDQKKALENQERMIRDINDNRRRK